MKDFSIHIVFSLIFFSLLTLCLGCDDVHHRIKLREGTRAEKGEALSYFLRNPKKQTQLLQFKPFFLAQFRAEHGYNHSVSVAVLKMLGVNDKKSFQYFRHWEAFPTTEQQNSALYLLGTINKFQTQHIHALKSKWKSLASSPSKVRKAKLLLTGFSFLQLPRNKQTELCKFLFSKAQVDQILSFKKISPAQSKKQKQRSKLFKSELQTRVFSSMFEKKFALEREFKKLVSAFRSCSLPSLRTVFSSGKEKYNKVIKAALSTLPILALKEVQWMLQKRAYDTRTTAVSQLIQITAFYKSPIPWVHRKRPVYDYSNLVPVLEKLVAKEQQDGYFAVDMLNVLYMLHGKSKRNEQLAKKMLRKHLRNIKSAIYNGGAYVQYRLWLQDLAKKISKS